MIIRMPFTGTMDMWQDHMSKLYNSDSPPVPTHQPPPSSGPYTNWHNLKCLVVHTTPQKKENVESESPLPPV